jgi:hypothetical protein
MCAFQLYDVYVMFAILSYIMFHEWPILPNIGFFYSKIKIKIMVYFVMNKIYISSCFNLCDLVNCLYDNIFFSKKLFLQSSFFLFYALLSIKTCQLYYMRRLALGF